MTSALNHDRTTQTHRAAIRRSPVRSRALRCRPLRRALSATLALAATVGAVAMVAGAGGCSRPAGPTIGFINDTDTLIRANFWTGERDRARKGGANMHNVEEFQVRARSRQQASLEPLLMEYSSAADSVVRLQVEPVSTSFKGAPEYWYELSAPSPFIVRVTKAPTGELKFSREGRGGLTPVPPEFWER
ncbi:MAG: hypothetical protein H7Y88_09430 [Phycisphaerales bacterium]|nr:hypothetical protein [Phycisphaerales bacterium]